MPAPNNIAIANIFHRIASCYRYLGNDHYEHVRTYEHAAALLRRLKEDVSKSAALETNFTEVIVNEIREFLEIGRIHHYQRFKNKVPVELLEILDIKGFGPAILKTIHEQLQINNLEQLSHAVQNGRLNDIAGITNIKLEYLKRSLKLYKPKRISLWEALARGNEMLRVLRLIPGVENASFSGSLRRGCDTIGDIDIVLQVTETKRENFLAYFSELPHVENIISSGWHRICAVLYDNLQLDIRMTTRSSFGAALLFYTGVPDHMAHLQNLAEQKGYTLTTEGLFESATQKYLAGKTEDGIYEKLDLQYIPPELREGGKEINLALRHMLPELLDSHQIKGDMRIFSQDMDLLANYVTKVYSQYEYVILTARSESFLIGNNRNWLQRVDDANERLGWRFLKKGVTVEILHDGTLDLPDEFLQQFDWVTAVVRKQLDRDLTGRLLKACENPLVNCIGNPSNGITGKKAPALVNWRLLFEKAASTATALEINSLPYSLDQQDQLLRKAVEKKVYFAISSCAETLPHCDYLQMGVTIAKRGWCTRANVLNTMHWDAIEAFKCTREYAL